MIHSKVISGFPGVGKTTLTNNPNGRVILDSDSSNFSWSSPGVRHPFWPKNYIDYIIEQLNSVDFILVSSHDVVRQALVDNQINFALVYPSLDIKQEYIQRYANRGNSEGFIALLEINYETWISELNQQTGCEHIVLNSGQYLADVL